MTSPRTSNKTFTGFPSSEPAAHAAARHQVSSTIPRFPEAPGTPGQPGHIPPPSIPGEPESRRPYALLRRTHAHYTAARRRIEPPPARSGPRTPPRLPPALEPPPHHSV